MPCTVGLKFTHDFLPGETFTMYTVGKNLPMTFNKVKFPRC